MTAALAHDTVDTTVDAAAGLRHPARMVPLFIAKWEDAYGNIYGILIKRRCESPRRRVSGLMLYRILDTVSDLLMP